MTITFENDQETVPVTDELRDLILRVIMATLSNQNFDYNVEIGVTIVDDDEITELNTVHRDINAATDVLSFPMLDFSSPTVIDPPISNQSPTILGDIVISAEKALAQSVEYEHSFEREMAFLAVHSTLHLLGYDHETSSEDERIMFTLQDEILNECNIPKI